MAKLVLLGGAAGVGKTTITQRYLNENPLTLGIEGDVIIAMMGQWIDYEDAARELLFELTKCMVATHLKAGRDVVLPYLVTDVSHVEAFEKIANESGARFIEVALMADKDEAIRRIFERGTWGEPGTPPLTKNDLPIVERLYDAMTAELKKRPGTTIIPAIRGDVETTYSQFCAATK